MKIVLDVFGLTEKAKYHTIIFLCLFFLKKIYFSILNKVSGFKEEKVNFPRFGVWYPDA